VSGANLTIDAMKITEDWNDLWNCKVLLLQNEIPESVNLAAANAAKRYGAKILLNAAPARHASKAFLDLVDVLVVNRVEAAMLSGLDDIDAALKALHRPARDVVLTRGGEGLSVIDRNGRVFELAALAVKMVSSHGAGDCFCGALAARLAAGDGLIEACSYARTAAGLFVAMSEEHRHEVSDEMVRARMK
jgi:ribokinase